MELTKPHQKLHRDLKEAASTLEKSVCDVFREAQAGSDSELVGAMEKIKSLYKQIDQLRAYADEVKAGRVVRARE
ncbi:hypothetical protein K5D33_07475 [Pseudomonas cichorii]|nr:hypothetical protein [Pseudomonas cichorii]MBX8534564.1 hypothetical protein [Pseudomonas cichorii]